MSNGIPTIHPSIHQVCLSGGPGGGKSTAIRALVEQFGCQVLVAPEVATMLLGSGFPAPGRDLEWSAEWQQGFQKAVLAVQQQLEESFWLVARQKGARMLICDRGRLDGAAYWPGGLEAFAATFNLDLDQEYRRYTAVIHLESMASAMPARYGKTENEQRFESMEEALEIEMRAREAWQNHPRWSFVSGSQEVSAKIAQVLGIVRDLLLELSGSGMSQGKDVREGTSREGISGKELQ